MHTTQLRRLAARWILRADHVETYCDIIDCAHAMLESGVYTYALGELATFTGESLHNDADPAGREPTRHSAFDQLFWRALCELNIEKPSKEAATREFVADILEPVYEGRSAGRTALNRFGELWRISSAEIAALLLGAGCSEIRQLHLEWDAATEIDNQPRLAELDRSVLVLCERWIPDHFRNHLRADLPANVRSIAQGIRADRAFDRLPILADALEDAGCTNAEVLEHCRQPQEHARGCWVVDLLLGKA